MYSRKVIAGVALAMAIIPALAFAETSTDTQAKIQALLSQIQELQKQLMVLVGSSGTFKPIGDPANAAGIVTGKISSVDSSSFVLQSRDGTKSMTVNVLASTTIQVFASSTPEWRTGSMSDIVVGRTAGVQGTQNSNGSVDAKTIKVGLVLAGETKISNLPPGQVGKALCIALKRNLTQGARGEDVKGLQEMLRQDPSLGFNAEATGVFGPLTAKAMMMFQRKNGITPADDGSVGPQTRGILMRRCGEGLDNMKTNMPTWGGRPTPVPPSSTTTPSGNVCTMEAAVCPAGQHAGGTCNHECLPDDTNASSTESGGT